jgi:hypothetical protein
MSRWDWLIRLSQVLCLVVAATGLLLLAFGDFFGLALGTLAAIGFWLTAAVDHGLGQPQEPATSPRPQLASAPGRLQTEAS